MGGLTSLYQTHTDLPGVAFLAESNHPGGAAEQGPKSLATPVGLRRWLTGQRTDQDITGASDLSGVWGIRVARHRGSENRGF